MLHHGLYEQIINTALNRELSEIPNARKSVAPIDKAEASKVLAQYLADVVQKGLDNVLDLSLIHIYGAHTRRDLSRQTPYLILQKHGRFPTVPEPRPHRP